jgi:hypothetical protein
VPGDESERTTERSVDGSSTTDEEPSESPTTTGGSAESPSSDDQVAESRTFDLVAPGPLGDPWTAVEARGTALVLSTPSDETRVSYADLRAVRTFPVGGADHGDALALVGLAGLLVGWLVSLVLRGVNRATGATLAAPQLSRYANEMSTTKDLTRVRLVTDDGSYYCYAAEETATALVDRLESRAHLDD